MQAQKSLSEYRQTTPARNPFPQYGTKGLFMPGNSNVQTPGIASAMQFGGKSPRRTVNPLMQFGGKSPRTQPIAANSSGDLLTTKANAEAKGKTKKKGEPKKKGITKPSKTKGDGKKQQKITKYTTAQVEEYCTQAKVQKSELAKVDYEMIQEMNSTEYAIPRASMLRLVKEAIRDIQPDYRLASDAFDMLQAAAEDHLAKHFLKSNIIAQCNNRPTVMKSDFDALSRIHQVDTGIKL